ncbi:hypothetical protein U8D42_17250 [Mycobacterium europaeum]|uniref:hypothetical protein n=1 Tax=Mycobacterium europaeum TaxID=761804 RepID=UPI002AE0927F|nr:hypothetical protein [Mycobacterium europaeum]MEA1159786.1 hypothetical protein [Mycobacterium europaeum]
MTNAARSFAQWLSRTPAKRETVEGDPAAQAFAELLAQRSVISGAVVNDDDEPWDKRVLRVLREDREWQERYQAEKAEREAREAEAQLSPAQRLARAIGGHNTAGPLPLNGTALLRQAIGGAGNSTINGQPAR